MVGRKKKSKERGEGSKLEKIEVLIRGSKTKRNSGDMVGAWELAAEAACEAGKGAEESGYEEKANNFYRQAGEAYEQIGEYDKAIDMYERSGDDEKASQISDERNIRKKKYWNLLNKLTSVVVFLLCLGVIGKISFNLTGNAILGISKEISNLVGILCFFVLIIFVSLKITVKTSSKKRLNSLLEELSNQ